MENAILPTSITNYGRTESELQVFWVFCILVAGKNSDTTARVVSRFFNQKAEEQSPFDYLLQMNNAGDLHSTLVANRVGQYHRITKALQETVNFHGSGRPVNLQTCTVDNLQSIHGVGPKTARFFLLHTRPDCECAVLDTHVLSYLRDKNLGNDIPTSTPTSMKAYRDLERAFLAMIQLDFPQLTVAEADLLIWSSYSGRLETDYPLPKE